MDETTESAMVRTARLRLEVQAPSGESARLVALAVAPVQLAEDPVLLFCVPGMTCTKECFDVGEGCSFARAAADDGHVVVAVDNLGTGESERPHDGDALSLAALADANAEAAAAVRVLASAGELVPGLPPLVAPRLVGVGHSVGGGLALLQQAAAASFDAIAIVGRGAEDGGERADAAAAGLFGP
jgi:alpha-beta hydrolase superfamily lysophospholipase